MQSSRIETHRKGDAADSSFCAFLIGNAQKEKESAVGNAGDDFPRRDSHRNESAGSVDTPTADRTLADLTDRELLEAAGPGAVLEDVNRIVVAA